MCQVLLTFGIIGFEVQKTGTVSPKPNTDILKNSISLIKLYFYDIIYL